MGLARAKLQKGDKGGALAKRTRLSHPLWRATVDRSVIRVPPCYQRADPRGWERPPGQHPYIAWDAAAGPYVIQQKYIGYAAAIRFASRLEAEYIAVEASGDISQQLALLNRQRRAVSLPEYSGPNDAASVMRGLFDQQRIDVWLKGKRLADFRRQPIAAARHRTVSGSAYWLPTLGAIGTQTCYPLPFRERDYSPKF